MKTSATDRRNLRFESGILRSEWSLLTNERKSKGQRTHFWFFAFLSLLAVELIFSVSAQGQTTIVNYDFNQAATYASFSNVVPLSTASGIACAASGTAVGVTTGTATTGTPYTANGITPNNIALSQLSGSGTSQWTFTLTGAQLSGYTSFNVYFQAQRQNGGANSVSISYSINGGSYLTTSITGSTNPVSLTNSGTWYASNFTMPSTLNNPSTSVAFRLTIATGNSGNTYLDNFQVRATGCATAAPTVTTPVNYCQNATPAQLTATGSGLLWYTVATSGTGSSTAPTPSTSAIGTTSYWVSQTVGCEGARAQINVVVTGKPGSSVPSSTNVTCNGLNNGTINVVASGGTAPYSFSIDNGATWVPEPIANSSHLFSGLAPGGPYKVIVRDANNCYSR